VLHSGRKSIVTEKPVEINTGITFKRMDLARTPKLVPSSESRGEVVRSISMVY
jgi:UDP-3-O-acyl-N-acetylglucosamine deacetylase